MEMLLSNLANLGHNPVAWAVAALAAAKTLMSLFLLFRCPVHRGMVDVTPEMAHDAAAHRFNPPASFLALVLLGMALAVGGLYMLADSQYGALALGAMVIGTFIFVTEPSRLTVIGNMNAVFAATPKGGEDLDLARDSLKNARRQRMLMELTITLAVFATLYFI